MTWYTGFYGSWRKGDFVTHLEGTYDRKKAFANAQETANAVGREVTVIAETGSVAGLKSKFYNFYPEHTHK